MVRDRLSEFQQKVGPPITQQKIAGTLTRTDETRISVRMWRFIPFYKAKQRFSTDMEMTLVDPEFALFFGQVAEIKTKITQLQCAVEAIHKLQINRLSLSQYKNNKNDKLDALRSLVKLNSREIRQKLKEMENAEILLDQTTNRFVSTITRKMQQSALFQKFVNIMRVYHAAQLEFEEMRESKSMNKDVAVKIEDETEVDGWVVIDAKPEEVEQALIAAQADEDALHEAEIYRHDVLQLEKSILELHELFIDMAILVDNQATTVDSVKTHVDKAQDKIRHAANNLVDGRRHKTKYFKRKLYIAVGLLVTGIIIIILIICLN